MGPIMQKQYYNMTHKDKRGCLRDPYRGHAAVVRPKPFPRDPQVVPCPPCSPSPCASTPTGSCSRSCSSTSSLVGGLRCLEQGQDLVSFLETAGP